MPGVPGVPVSLWLVGLGVDSLSRMRRAFLVESQGDMSMAEDGPPLWRRRTQELDCGVDHRWVAVFQSVERRMLSYLDHSEVLKVNTRELEHHVLAPNEPDVDMEHIVM